MAVLICTESWAKQPSMKTKYYSSMMTNTSYSTYNQHNFQAPFMLCYNVSLDFINYCLMYGTSLLIFFIIKYSNSYRSDCEDGGQNDTSGWHHDFSATPKTDVLHQTAVALFSSGRCLQWCFLPGPGCTLNIWMTTCAVWQSQHCHLRHLIVTDQQWTNCFVYAHCYDAPATELHNCHHWSEFPMSQLHQCMIARHLAHIRKHILR